MMTTNHEEESYIWANHNCCFFSWYIWDRSSCSNMEVIPTLEEEFQDFTMNDKDIYFRKILQYLRSTAKRWTLSLKNFKISKTWWITQDLINTKVPVIPKVYRTERTGLIQFFLNRSFLKGGRLWINKKLLKRRKKKALNELLTDYIGLELAMSLTQLNHAHHSWSSRRFLGSAELQWVRYCDTFTDISSSLRLYPGYDHAVAALNPLWHSQIMLQNFVKNTASIAVPKSCSALDGKRSFWDSRGP